MKLITFGILLFALAFCGLGDRIKQLSGGNANTASSNSGSASKSSGAASDPAKPSSAQQAIIDSGTETAWPDQGLSWRLPAGWKKTDVKKESFDYASPDNAF